MTRVTFVCGMPPAADGKWHRLSYVEADEAGACQRCKKWLAAFVRKTKSRSFYLCAACHSIEVA